MHGPSRSHSTCRRGAVALALLVLALPSTTLAQQPQVVRSTGPGAWGEKLRLVEEIRIGKLDGSEEYLFGDVAAVAVGRAGMIYVADGQVPIIRSYDANGRFVRNIGRKGGGPGEYGAIGGMRTLRDGQLALWDNRNQRITIYVSDGELADTYRVASGLFADDIFQVDTGGRFYVRTMLGDLHRATNPDEGWIRVSPTGQVMDTVRIPSDPARAESFVLSTPSGFDRPFVRELVTAISSLGYMITGRNEPYAFEQHRPGAPALRIERAAPVVPLTRAERAEWLAWVDFFQRRAANPGASNPAVLGASRRPAYTIPETKPAFSELRTDSQGRIWVRRYVTAVSHPGPERPPGDQRPRRIWREPPTFDVFEPSGRFLGTLAMPWSAALYDARDRQVWATVRGESDETYVVRFRIEATP